MRFLCGRLALSSSKVLHSNIQQNSWNFVRIGHPPPSSLIERQDVGGEIGYLRPPTPPPRLELCSSSSKVRIEPWDKAKILWLCMLKDIRSLFISLHLDTNSMNYVISHKVLQDWNNHVIIPFLLTSLHPHGFPCFLPYPHVVSLRHSSSQYHSIPLFSWF